MFKSFKGYFILGIITVIIHRWIEPMINPYTGEGILLDYVLDLGIFMLISFIIFLILQAIFDRNKEK